MLTSSLYQSGLYSDCTIQCGANEYRAHSNLLCSRSEVFAAMLDVDAAVRPPELTPKL